MSLYTWTFYTNTCYKVVEIIVNVQKLLTASITCLERVLQWLRRCNGPLFPIHGFRDYVNDNNVVRHIDHRQVTNGEHCGYRNDILDCLDDGQNRLHNDNDTGYALHNCGDGIY